VNVSTVEALPRSHVRRNRVRPAKAESTGPFQHKTGSLYRSAAEVLSSSPPREAGSREESAPRNTSPRKGHVGPTSVEPHWPVATLSGPNPPRCDPVLTVLLRRSRATRREDPPRQGLGSLPEHDGAVRRAADAGSSVVRMPACQRGVHNLKDVSTYPFVWVVIGCCERLCHWRGA
jgi:hypothetical protein